MFPGLITHLTQGDMKSGKLEIDLGKFSNETPISRSLATAGRIFHQ